MSASVTLDHTQDLTGSEQYRLTRLYAPPEFVKVASYDQLYGGTGDLSSHLYADPARRVYPCHTKSATWMSALFFGDKRSQLPAAKADQIRDRIMKSAEYWHIKPDVEQLWEKMAADVADAMSRVPDDDFALVWEAGGRRERHYPLRNSGEVKLASQWFSQHHAAFTFQDKHTIATKILQKAAAYGAATHDAELLDRCAGYGYCSAAVAADAWEKRAGLTASSFPDYSTQAHEVASSLRAATFEARDQGRRIKMAELMDQFDRQTNLVPLYGPGGLDRPEDVLFQITEKVASEFLADHVQTTTGAIYEKLALDKLDIETVRSWLGDDFADEVGGVLLDSEKLATLLPTLPRPEAEMFERMARNAGVSPAIREKAAEDQGLTDSERRDLAAEYVPAS